MNENIPILQQRKSVITTNPLIHTTTPPQTNNDSSNAVSSTFNTLNSSIVKCVLDLSDEIGKKPDQTSWQSHTTNILLKNNRLLSLIALSLYIAIFIMLLWLI
jgi:hypothetical protein